MTILALTNTQQKNISYYCKLIYQLDWVKWNIYLIQHTSQDAICLTRIVHRVGKHVLGVRFSVSLFQVIGLANSAMRVILSSEWLSLQ